MDTTDQANAATRRMHDIFAAQRRAFAAEPHPLAERRRDQLRALREQLRRYQDALATAVDHDFGARAAAETKMLDILPSILAIDHAVRKLRSWMRPSGRRAELLLATNSLQVIYQPKGVVGIVVPWNFPLYLLFGPLAAALSAGNRVMIKMSEVLPRTQRVLQQLLQEIYADDEVALFGAELSDPRVFTAMPFDHLVFTGSPTVGRQVMAAAAQNLTPVTLELGGKSPAIVLPDYPLDAAARSLAFGKGANCGQICVSPDYALVPRAQLENFAAALQAAFGDLYRGGVADNADYTGIVDARQLARIEALLDDARERGARIVACGAGRARKMPLQIVTGVTSQMRLMREEIFGPVLPLVGYDTLDEAIGFVNALSRPLALYCYTHDRAARERVLEETRSGGVTLNDCAWHIINHDAPFGGIGESGMGSYHGPEGFRELSHARTVLGRHRFFPIRLFHPPYGNWAQKLVARVYLGHADPQVSAGAAATVGTVPVGTRPPLAS